MNRKIVLATVVLFFLWGPFAYSLGDLPFNRDRSIREYLFQDSITAQVINRSLESICSLIPRETDNQKEKVKEKNWTRNHFPGLFSREKDRECSLQFLNPREHSICFNGLTCQDEQESFNHLWKQVEVYLSSGLMIKANPEPAKETFRALTPRSYHQWPLSGGVVTSVFGVRKPVIDKDLGFKSLAFHYGLDLAGPQGSLIRASAAGKILYAGKCGNYGNTVIIKHGNGDKTLYGHLNKMYIKTGDLVNQHFIIGSMGSSGLSTGPHLHFEISRKGTRVDPMILLPCIPDSFIFASYFINYDKALKKYINI